MTRGPSIPLANALTLLVALTATGLGHAKGPVDESALKGFVWHAEDASGRALTSHGADVAVNPASVVKVATSAMALDTLGFTTRQDTRFFVTGPLDATTGEVAGDLVVRGGDDPDFHLENAFLVARALHNKGVRKVAGAVRVDGRFTLGWEGGSEGRREDPARRVALMAWRLKRALDPDIWSHDERKAWARFAERTGADIDNPISIKASSYGALAQPPDAAPLVVHRSKPLGDAVRRFTAFSNNDIERIGDVLGGPAAVRKDLATRLQTPADALTLETTSGLGVNRLSPRQMVRLVRSAQTSARRRGRSLDEVLPRGGCGPSTFDNFDRLADGDYAQSVVGKTGTLFDTDGGVSVLVGVARAKEGDITFAIARPRAGSDSDPWRAREERFVTALIDAHGGPRPATCPPALAEADEGARIDPPPRAPGKDDDAVAFFRPASGLRLASVLGQARASCVRP